MNKEELERAWMSRAVQSNHRYDEKSFKEGAEWMQKKMIEKSYMWIIQHFMEFVKIENLGSCAHEITIYNEKLWDKYSKAMEE